MTNLLFEDHQVVVVYIDERLEGGKRLDFFLKTHYIIV